MILFIVLASMTVAALVLLVPPLLFRSRDETPRGDFDLQIYRDQLGELGRDEERGLISAEQAVAARTEVERRMLTAAGPGDDEGGDGAPGTSSLITAFALALALPIAAGSLYLWLGSPGLGNQPFAGREMPSPVQAADDADMADIGAMVAGLADKLVEEPDNLEGWIMLARSYNVLGRFGDAVAALESALPLNPDDPAILSMLGEFRIFAAEGVVTPAAAEALRQALEIDPAQPAPRFYLALGKAQAGDLAGALDGWVALARDTPADAPYTATLRERIAETAAELGVDVAGLDFAPPPNEAADELGGELDDDQMTMIRGMVARLAARLEDEPNDLDGWLRLGRSYGVLGDPAGSRDAYGRAAALAPDNVEAVQSHLTAIVEAAPPDAALPPAAAAAAERLAALDADNPTALWLLGRARAEAGETDAARVLWNRLRDQLPPGGSDHAALGEAIDELGTP